LENNLIESNQNSNYIWYFFGVKMQGTKGNIAKYISDGEILNLKK
jgi:hypothetical protein